MTRSTVFRSNFSSMDLPLSLLDRMVSITASAREEDEQSAFADFVLVLELLPMLSIDGVMGGL